MHIAIDYIYRDAGNYKQWNRVIFANPTALNAKDLEVRIRSRLISGMFFEARVVRLEELFVHKFDPDLDHGWHEIDSVWATEEGPNDLFGRTIEEFMGELTSWWCLTYR
jgi:hypothetical protein